MKILIYFVLSLGILTYEISANKIKLWKQKNIKEISKNIFLNTDIDETNVEIESGKFYPIKFTKQNVLPTVIKFKQAIINKNIEELMTFYSEENFYDYARDAYSRHGVKTESMEEFKSVWKKDIEQCKRDGRLLERLDQQDRFMCILFLISDGLKTGEYLFLINLETPIITFNYYKEMDFTLIIYDKDTGDMWTGFLFKQEKNTFKIENDRGLDIDYMRYHYDPDHPNPPWIGDR